MDTTLTQPMLQQLAICAVDEHAPRKVLVQWSGKFPEDATWEDLDAMATAYPDLHLEVKVFVKG
jgi:hypothetical protein